MNNEYMAEAVWDSGARDNRFYTDLQTALTESRKWWEEELDANGASVYLSVVKNDRKVFEHEVNGRPWDGTIWWDGEYTDGFREQMNRVEIDTWLWHGEPAHCANVRLDGEIIATVLRSMYWKDADGDIIDPDELEDEREPDGEHIEFSDDVADAEDVDWDEFVALRALEGYWGGVYDLE